MALTPMLLVSSTAALIYLGRSAATKNVNPNYITWSVLSIALLFASLVFVYVLWWHRRHRRRVEANWAKLEIQKWKRDGREKAREAERVGQLVERLREGLRTRSHSRGDGEGARSVSRGRRKRQETMKDKKFGETNVGVEGTTEQGYGEDKRLGSDSEIKIAVEKMLNAQGTMTESTVVNSNEGNPSSAVLENQPVTGDDAQDVEVRNIVGQSPVYENQDGVDSSDWWAEATKSNQPRVTSVIPLPRRVSSLAHATSHHRNVSGTSSSRPSMPDTLPSQKSFNNSPVQSSGSNLRSLRPQEVVGHNHSLSASSQVQTFPNVPWTDRPSTSKYIMGDPLVISPVSAKSLDTIPSGLTDLYNRVIGDSRMQSNNNQSSVIEDELSTSQIPDLSERRNTITSTTVPREGHGEMGSLQSDDNFLAANELEEDAVSYNSEQAELRRGRSRERVSPWLEEHEDSYETIEGESKSKERGEASSRGRGRRKRMTSAWRAMRSRVRGGSSGEWRKDASGHWYKVTADEAVENV